MEFHFLSLIRSDESWLAANSMEIAALVLQLFGMLLAAFFVVRQIKLTKAEDIKLRIFDDFVDAHRKATAALSDASWCPKKFEMELFTYVKAVNFGVKPDLPKARVKDFMELNWKAADAAIRVITLIEGSQCVEPRFILFQKAIGAALEDIRDSFLELSSSFTKTLPIDLVTNVGVKTIPTARLDDNLLEFLKPKIQDYYDKCDILMCWLADLNVELQNVFMRPLFKKKARHRQPKDQKYRVMSFEKYEACNTFLENDTKWGREKKKYEG